MFSRIDCLLSLVGILSQLTWIYNGVVMPILTWILEIIRHPFQNTKLNLYIILLNLLTFYLLVFYLIFHLSTMSLKGKSLLCIYSLACSSHAMNLAIFCIIWNFCCLRLTGTFWVTSQVILWNNNENLCNQIFCYLQWKSKTLRNILHRICCWIYRKPVKK